MYGLTKALVGLAALGVGAWLMSRRRPADFSFRDKVVLITGGSRGLGLVLARMREGQSCTASARFHFMEALPGGGQRAAAGRSGRDPGDVPHARPRAALPRTR